MHPFQAALNRTSLVASFDEGASWTSVRDLADVVAVAVDPNSPSTVYAGGSGGVFKSTDSGRNWILLNTGLNTSTTTGLYVRFLTIDPVNSGTLYVGVSSTLP